MKDKVISFRLTKSEYQLLKRLSDAEGLEIKDYIKHRIFREPVSYKLSCNDREEIQQLEGLIQQLQKELNNSKNEIKENTKSYASAIVKQIRQELQKKDCNCASNTAVIATAVVSTLLIITAIAFTAFWQ